jgi:dephospho-CoA kinase
MRPAMDATRAAHKPIIGVTGAIGGGKSTAAGLMRALGAAVIDADALARGALDVAEVRDTLKAWWGAGVLDAAGGVDRRAVGKIVFGNGEELKCLEALVHPLVHRERAALRQRYQDDPEVLAIVEDCPLLFEAEIAKTCDAVVFVDAPRAVRLARLKASRGWEGAELDRRESNQWPLDTKRAAADYVVDNHADLAELDRHVRRVFSQIVQGRH